MEFRMSSVNARPSGIWFCARMLCNCATCALLRCCAACCCACDTGCPCNIWGGRNCSVQNDYIRYGPDAKQSNLLWRCCSSNHAWLQAGMPRCR